MQHLRDKVKLQLRGAQLFAAFIVGRIPIHHFRLWFYIRVLQIKIGPRSLGALARGILWT